MKTEVDRILNAGSGLKVRFLHSSEDPGSVVMRIYARNGPADVLLDLDELRDAIAAVEEKAGRGNPAVHPFRRGPYGTCVTCGQSAQSFVHEREAAS